MRDGRSTHRGSPRWRNRGPGGDRATHPSFTDLGLLADQFGVPLGAAAPGLRTMTITRALLRAFFDRHLRDVRTTPFDHLLHADHPEVRFCAPPDDRAGG
ncbi:hypothetical protein ACIQ9R_19245 [Streptomyces sp. NPDC094447]|uniref:hypothetical protein n=1 Tax=unclassified Streptomyces TaxID=2593676 RepID=UPI003712DD29